MIFEQYFVSLELSKMYVWCLSSINYTIIFVNLIPAAVLKAYILILEKLHGKSFNTL